MKTGIELSEEQLKSHIESVTNLNEMIRNGHTDLVDWLNEDVLEVVVIKRNDVISGVSLLVTLGGPNIYYELSNNISDDYLEVKVYWGGNNCSQGVYAPDLCQALSDLYEIEA
jgi:hypothetical protein